MIQYLVRIGIAHRAATFDTEHCTDLVNAFLPLAEDGFHPMGHIIECSCGWQTTACGTDHEHLTWELLMHYRDHHAKKRAAEAAPTF